MLSKFRNHSKIIVIIVVVAMIVTGGLFSYSAYLNRGSQTTTPSNYIATINDEKISYQHFYSVLQNSSREREMGRMDIIPYQLNVLDSIIDTELILQEAEALNVEVQVSDEEIQEYIDIILDANEMDRDELKELMEMQDSSMEEYEGYVREILRQNHLIEQVQEMIYADLQVSDEEIARAYEEIRPQVIVKSFDGDKEEARRGIEEALEKINDGVDFEDVVDDYSDYQIDDGDLGFVGYDYFSKEASDKIFAMEIGELSDIINDEQGYMIVKIKDKKIADGEEFEGKKAELESNILQEKQKVAFVNWLEENREKNNVQIHDPLLSGYRALAKGKYQQATEELESALELYSTPALYIYLANAYQENGQEDKAINTFENAVNNYEDDWELLFNYAVFLTNLEDPRTEKALELYDRVSELAGDEFMAHYQLYITYSQLGEEERAENEMNIINELQQNMIAEQERLEQERLESMEEDIEMNEIDSELDFNPNEEDFSPSTDNELSE